MPRAARCNGWRRRLAAFRSPCAVALCLALPASASGLELEYRGYIAGAPAGSARISVERQGENYIVRGTISTRGLVHRISPWRARFVAAGHLLNGVAVPQALAVAESARRKKRTIHVASGVLRERRNGKLRPQKPAPAGLNLMSALWVEPRCAAEQTLNNGRREYAMTLSKRVAETGGAERCFYDITDDKGDRSRGWVAIGQRGGMRVPLQIVVIEGVTRRLELASAKERLAAAPTFGWGLREAQATVTPALP